jgi:hypothetical protein
MKAGGGACADKLTCVAEIRRAQHTTVINRRASRPRGCVWENIRHNNVIFGVLSVLETRALGIHQYRVKQKNQCFAA